MKYKDIDITWLGHSGFKIKTSIGRVIYIDPFKISEESESADFIFITHSHYDHCSIEDIQKIANDGTIVICPADVSSKFRHINSKVNIKIAEPGAKMQFDEQELKFWCIPAYNLSKPFHTKEEDWVGYVIDLNGTLIYHAGDTDLIPEMKQLATVNIDIALLPIGGNFTMNSGEAAKAVAIIKPKLALPMHYGSVAKTGDKSEGTMFLKNCGREGVEAKVLNLES